MKNTFIFLASILLPLSAFADTQTVNGITWTYTVSSGKASVGGGSYSSPAVPTSTAGAITIPSRLGGYPVTSIGSYAFYGCSGLTSIAIPDGVTSIGRAAFYGCSGLTSIAIPDGVTSIGGSTFYGCSGLTSVTIPDGVTSIGGSAFSWCSGLTSVTIPNSVTSIGDEAFTGCSAIKIVVLPGRFQMSAIFPSSFRSITDATIAQDSTGIAGSMFSGCSGLTSITIPNGVTSIGNYAFSGCSGLTSITIPDGVTSIGSNAFYGCSGLTSVTIPDAVTSIGSSAFYGCSGLMSITIGNGVTSIGSSAFSNCSELTEVYISDLAAWCGISFGDSSSNPCCYAHRLFLDGEEIMNLVIPDGVTGIGSRAFSGCSGLTSVTIPDSVTSIGSSAFYGCSGLTSITIPDSVTNIGDNAFYGCSRLEEVHISDLATWCGIDFGVWSNPLECAHHLFVNGSEVTDLVVPGNVTRIGGAAFRRCHGLTSVTIPDQVVEIGGWAFSDCTNLVSATIGNSVTNIGSNAFYHCSGLTSITIPDSVTSIGLSAFDGCSGLTEVHISDLAAWCGIAFRNSESNPCYYAHHLFLDGGEVTSLVIPDGVTSVGSYAFQNCSELTSVTIPNSVTSIGSSAFSGCSGLTSITIPNSVASIGEKAFKDCSAIKSVVLPGQFQMSTIFPASYGSITNATVAQGSTSIGDSAFYHCSGLTGSLTIPDGVTSIGSYAFYNCSGLTGSLTIPDGVTSIGSYAFYNCSGLRSVTIPDSVTSIGESAFSGCFWIEELFVPGDVATIESSAFSGCTGLARLSLPSRFSGNTDSMGIPEGCVVSFYNTVRLGIYSDSGTPVPRVGDHPRALNEVVSCSAGSTVTDNGGSTRFVCRGWEGTGSVPASGTGTNVTFRIEMNSNIRWLWRTEDRVDWTVVFDDGSVLSGTGWCEDGAALVVPLAGDNDFRRFESWSPGPDSGDVVVDLDGRTLSIPVSGPRSVSVSINALSLSALVETGDVSPAWHSPENEGRWQIRPDETADDGYSLRSGPLSANSVAAVEASVEGPGTLSFDWRISSARGHYARFLLDGEPERTITRSTEWSTETFVLGDGSHDLRWVYEKGSGATGGEDAAFLDNVRWSPVTLEAALDATNLVWSTEGEAPWTPQTDVSADGADAAKRGAVSGASVSRLATTVEGPGTLSWKWKSDVAGTAGVEVYLDNRDLYDEDVYLEGASDWSDASLEIEGDGTHVVVFEFWNGGTAATVSDCAYIDCVSWTPSRPASVVVEGVDIPVSWLDENAADFVVAAGGDAARAAEAQAANGVNKVWQCYVAGISPTNAAARFEARIEIENGVPVVKWSPDLNEGGTRNERVYTVEGQERLGDGWGPTNATSRFFRVKVAMPQE